MKTLLVLYGTLGTINLIASQMYKNDMGMHYAHWGATIACFIAFGVVINTLAKEEA